MFFLICAVLLLLWVVSAATLRRVTASAGPRYYAAMLLLRTLGLLAFLLLIWKIFWGPEKLILEALHPSEAPEVIVLQDRSASMDILGKSGSTRKELSEMIWSDVVHGARRHLGRSGRPVRRYFFAENLVEESREDLILRDGTKLNQAFTELLSRETLHSLLILSDGNSTDGLVPAYFLDWARNRNIRASAICCVDPDLEIFDRSIQEVLCEQKNPFSLTVKVKSLGRERSPFEISFSIDGSRVVQLKRPPAPLQEVVFRLPPLEKGWHEYSIRIEPKPGEATDLNNTFYGVFRVDQSRVLFIHHRPGMESVQLARFLKRELEENFFYLSAGELSADDTSLRDASIVTLADVPPNKIPKVILDKWISRRIPLVILGREPLGAWADLDLPGFPLIRVGGTRFLGQKNKASSLVSLSSHATFQEALQKNPVELKLDLLQESQLHKDALFIIGMQAEEELLPVLVSDSLEKPRYAVLLADTTWKWALSPNLETRRGYQMFWSSCLGWLRGVEQSEGDLVLEVERREDFVDEIWGSIRAADSREGISLVDCRISIGGGGPMVQAKKIPESNRYSFRFRGEEGKIGSGVLWLQAFAGLDGVEVTSERVPVAFNRNLNELDRIHPDREMLKAFTTGEGDGFSWFGGRAEVIDSLFREATARSGGVKVKRRNPLWELLLAAAAFCCLGLEWWLERRLYAGKTQ